VQQVRDERGFGNCVNESRCLVTGEDRPYLAVEELKLAQVLRQFRLADDLRRATRQTPNSVISLVYVTSHGFILLDSRPSAKMSIAPAPKYEPATKHYQTNPTIGTHHEGTIP
jgi:hypothetical protein